MITIDRGSMEALPSSGERIAMDASRRESLLAATLCIRDGLWLVPRISSQDLSRTPYRVVRLTSTSDSKWTVRRPEIGSERRLRLRATRGPVANDATLAYRCQACGRTAEAPVIRSTSGSRSRARWASTIPACLCAAETTSPKVGPLQMPLPSSRKFCRKGSTYR